MTTSELSHSVAYFGAGCFWNAELQFHQVEGVLETEVGYCGVKNSNSTSKNEVEVVKINFDPNEITFESLLDVFWKIHDPTSRRNVVESNIERSVIFYTSSDQEKTAFQSKSNQNNKLTGNNQITTQITKLTSYNKADSSQQRYYFK